jgi:hypothetical protein
VAWRQRCPSSRSALRRCSARIRNTVASTSRRPAVSIPPAPRRDRLRSPPCHHRCYRPATPFRYRPTTHMPGGLLLESAAAALPAALEALSAASPGRALPPLPAAAGASLLYHRCRRPCRCRSRASTRDTWRCYRVPSSTSGCCDGITSGRVSAVERKGRATAHDGKLPAALCRSAVGCDSGASRSRPAGRQRHRPTAAADVLPANIHRERPRRRRCGGGS